MTRDKAIELFEQHKRTGEPLSEDEVTAIVGAGLADETDFNMVGGWLYRYEPGLDPNMPKADDEPDNEEEPPDPPGDGFGDSIEAADYYRQQREDGAHPDPTG